MKDMKGPANPYKPQCGVDYYAAPSFPQKMGKSPYKGKMKSGGRKKRSSGGSKHY